jgi:hypothetical protein
MDNEVYSFALKNTLDEIQKICPDIKNAFVLTENCELIAADENTPEETVSHAIEALKDLLEKAEAIGGGEDINIEGLNGRVNVSRIEEIYLVTVTSRKADLNHVNTVTRVLVPTVLKLLEKLAPTPLKKNPPKLETEPEKPPSESVEEPIEQHIEEPEMDTAEESPEPQDEPESIRPEPPVNQFIVEDMKGLLAPSDTVRIDSETIEQWDELYEDMIIEEAEIGTFSGKSIRCKVKPIKDSKIVGQGKIQIPGKLQLALEIKKGELVRVKPVVE